MRVDDATQDWRAFIRTAAWSALGLAVALYGFVIAMDPYGTRVAAGDRTVPIMDINQRYMYPQIARAALYDSAVFGTSTMRLLDPERLDGKLGGRFANFAMNAATPWEQAQLLALYLRHRPHPGTLVFGIDRHWCLPHDARLSFRSFPPWLYEEGWVKDLPHLFDFRSIEIAGRVALARLGLARERMRRDGYGIFTPPESRYDLAQARRHIRANSSPFVEGEESAPASGSRGGADPFPSLAWLSQMLDRVPPETRMLVVMPPIHVAAQAVPDTPDAARERACTARVLDLAARHGATVVDYRRPSAITTEDSNYWDPLHYRIGLAARIVDDLAAVAAGGRDAADGTYRVIRPGA